MCGYLWRFLTGRPKPPDSTEQTTLSTRIEDLSYQPEPRRWRYEPPPEYRQQPCNDFYFAVEAPPTTTRLKRRPVHQDTRQLSSRVPPQKPSYDVEMWRRRVSASHGEAFSQVGFYDPFPDANAVYGEALVSGSKIIRSFDLASAAPMMAAHERETYSLPQAQVSAASRVIRTKGCTVCLEELETSRFVVRALHTGTMASHEDDTCLSCWKKHVRIAVEGSGADVRCVSSRCRELLTEQEVKRRASPTRYARYLDNLTLATLRSDPQYRECPSATCKNGVIHESGHTFQCQVCGYRYCTECEVPMHEGQTCSQYRSRKQRTVKDRATESWLERHTRACPSCTIHIKKEGGCDHMTCRFFVGREIWVYCEIKLTKTKVVLAGTSFAGHVLLRMLAGMGFG
ncbi:hypothetical protein LTR86_008106 [Recurvomyces mirabilis]|nr:hypothetical protein LTR86_008106 [Recurvomyces mirabilis]